MSSPESSSPTPQSCPSVDNLRSYARGQLSQADAHRLTQHLDNCARCSSLVFILPQASESLISALRQGTPAEPIAKPVADTAPHTKLFQATPPPPPDPSQPLRIDRYTILNRIGRGGFGTVYLGHDQELDRLVAIKVPHPHRLGTPEQLEGYLSEARLLAGLDHRHVVPVYDAGRTAEVPFFLVSKFIQGQDLSSRLKARLPSFVETAHLVATVAEALDYMHEQGLVHCDIKPKNILVDRAGQPHVLDFGLARRQVTEASGELRIAGTPAYMSPEQVQGQTERLGPATDIYSLGVVLYELLTGVKPFQGELAVLREQIIKASPPLPWRQDGQVPGDLAAICMKALAKEPGQRYGRAGEMAKDLRCFLGGEPPRYCRPVGRVEKSWSWVRRNRVLTAAVGVAALVFLLVGLALRPKPQAAPPLRPTLQVKVPTEPAGADLFFVPLDDKTGIPQPKDGKRGRADATVALHPGQYLVVAALEDGRFHEVFRTVPENPGTYPGGFDHYYWQLKEGIIHLPTISLPPVSITNQMCLFPEGEFTMGSMDLPGKPPKKCRVPSFFLDPTEVTVDQHRQRRPGFTYPAEHVNSPDDHPLTFISWDDAVRYAEKFGKRLPDEMEYEYAATACGQKRFPWGNFGPPTQDWFHGSARQPIYDRLELPGQTPVFGLFSNALEWTSSWHMSFAEKIPNVRAPSQRVIRGGPREALEITTGPLKQMGLPQDRLGLDFPLRHPGLGFRCARSAKPRLQASDFFFFQ